MAEICCGVVGGSEASATACEPTSRVARRRRMGIRRFRFVSGVAAAPTDSSRKRPRIECSGPAAVSVAGVVPLDLDADLGGERFEGGDAVAVGNYLRSSADPGEALNPEPTPSPASARAMMASEHCLRYGVTSVRGRRRDMEDAVSIRPDFARRDGHLGAGLDFFGVYDGHGCSHVSDSSSHPPSVFSLLLCACSRGHTRSPALPCRWPCPVRAGCTRWWRRRWNATAAVPAHSSRNRNGGR